MKKQRRARGQNRNYKLALQALESRCLLSAAVFDPAQAQQVAGYGPVATGDFDGDGDIDIAVTAVTTVGIMLNRGDGTFDAPLEYESFGGISNGIDVADLNHDGHLDIVSASINGDNVAISVVLGNGDGTLRTRVLYDLPGRELGVAIADMNADGHLDLVVTTDYTYAVSVLRGNGDGTFLAPILHDNSGWSSWDAVVADFNNDNKPDVVIPVSAGLGVMLGDNTGHLAPKIESSAGVPTQYSLHAYDFDGDGNMDIAMGGSNWMSISLGNGDGTFANPISYSLPIYCISLSMADVTGDGKMDLLGTGYFTLKVLVFAGNGDGTFADYQELLTAGVVHNHSVATGDFDGDGLVDVVATGYGSGTDVFTFHNALLAPQQQATALSILDQPQSTPAGSPLSPIRVAIVDQSNQIWSTSTALVTAVIETGSGQLLGTVSVNAVNGIATFDNLILPTAGTYTLKFISNALAPAISDSFNVTTPATTASRLCFKEQPSNTVAGQVMDAVVIELKDASGNLVTDDNSPVTLSIFRGPSAATLVGTLTVNAVNGIATFSDLSLLKAGRYVLRAADGALVRNSRCFKITADRASAHLAVQLAPHSGAVDRRLRLIVLKVVDQYGNLVNTNRSRVTLTADGDIGGQKHAKVHFGHAFFWRVVPKSAGTLTLTFTNSSLADPSPVSISVHVS